MISSTKVYNRLSRHVTTMENIIKINIDLSNISKIQIRILSRIHLKTYKNAISNKKENQLKCPKVQQKKRSFERKFQNKNQHYLFYTIYVLRFLI